MNFKQMRKKLAYWGISAPESDEELGSKWGYYKKKIQRKMSSLESMGRRNLSKTEERI